MSGYDVKRHFDEIAGGYREEIPGHIREHLLNKWWGLVSSRLEPGMSVLDVGCGEGSNASFLKSLGMNVTGLDLSGELIRNGRRMYPEIGSRLFEGSALALPFADGVFDAATMTGVLHHIHSRSDQMSAVEEALRVVCTGGCVIIRECNLINPLFRIFWNYIFPLTAKIDRFGGENWLSAGKLAASFPGRVVEVDYFTFLPNFTPGFILPLAKKIEAFLERSFMRRLSAHYVAVLKKSGQ